jgi:hypothetical protein
MYSSTEEELERREFFADSFVAIFGSASTVPLWIESISRASSRITDITSLYGTVIPDVSEQILSILTEVSILTLVRAFGVPDILILNDPNSIITGSIEHLFEEHRLFVGTSPYPTIRAMVAQHKDRIPRLPALKQRGVLDPIEGLVAMEELLVAGTNHPQLSDELRWIVCQSFVQENVLSHCLYKWKTSLLSERYCNINEDLILDIKCMLDMLSYHPVIHSLVSQLVIGNVALDVLGFVSDYVETCNHALDEKILQWGEIFADLHSRMRRANLPNEKVLNMPNFKIVFEYLGILAETDTRVVFDWCLSHIATIPFRYLHQLILHSSANSVINSEFEYQFRQIADSVVAKILDSCIR